MSTWCGELASPPPMEALPCTADLYTFRSPASHTSADAWPHGVGAARPLLHVSNDSSFCGSLLQIRFTGAPHDWRSHPLTKASDHDHGHHHNHHHHDHHHHHGHHHGHRHGNRGNAELTGPQRALGEFAWTIGWVDLANSLRENLQMCGYSTAFFLAAAACPYLVPKPMVKPL